MRKEYPGYSLEQAFAFMVRDMEHNNDPALDSLRNKRTPLNLDHFNTDCDVDLEGEILDRFEDSGYALGVCMVIPGENPNQNQTQLQDVIVKGDKKWKTAYIGIWDTPFGTEVVEGSKQEIKKNCVDICREKSALEKRDIFILIGKSPDEFPRCAAQCNYKPSPNQKIGMYKFVW